MALAMCRNISTHSDSKDTKVGNLHGVLVEGDGVEALGLLQDDGGGGTQASLTCVEATGGTALSVKVTVKPLEQRFKEASQLQVACDGLRWSGYFLLCQGNLRGSASFRSSLLSLLMDEDEDILWTCVCRFCSSTTAKDKASEKKTKADG